MTSVVRRVDAESPVANGRHWWASRERARRARQWRDLAIRYPDGIAPAAVIREIRIYGAFRGVFIDKATTASSSVPEGIAVGLRHDGSSYADELSDDGLIYHYPVTQRPGNDAAEVAAIKAAMDLQVPVFAVLGRKDDPTREVRTGFVEAQDDSTRSFLITFQSPESVELSAAGAEGNEYASGQSFSTEGPTGAARYGMIAHRPNQVRFKFDVLSRYGPRCAVCSVDQPQLLQAAHLRPKSARGSDDALNGLVLCANHHLALDAGLWRVVPETLRVALKDGVSHAQLGLDQHDLVHLKQLPHIDSLRWLWDAGFVSITSLRPRAHRPGGQ